MNYKPLIERKLWDLVEQQNELKRRLNICRHPTNVREMLERELEYLNDKIEMTSEDLEECS